MVDLGRQILPKIVGETGFTVLTIAHTGTPGRIDLLVDGIDDLCNENLVAIA